MRRNYEGGGICHTGPQRAGCNKVVQPLCDVTRNTQVVRGTAAGAVWTINFQLARCNFFQALGARMHSLDANTPTVVRAAEVQQVDINGCAQEAGSQTAAAANTTIVGLMRDFDTPDECACPIAWGIFGRQAFAENLVVAGVNIDVAAADQYVTLLGNCLSACPPGLEVGKPFTGGFS
jgi:hypothetical protein